MVIADNRRTPSPRTAMRPQQDGRIDFEPKPGIVGHVVGDEDIVDKTIPGDIAASEQNTAAFPLPGMSSLDA